MKLEYQILAAVALDLALGDPRWLPHPVRALDGWLHGWKGLPIAAGGERLPPWPACLSP